MGAHERRRALRVAGCDLGKAAVKLVVLTVEEGRSDIERNDCIAHDGGPVEAFAAWYRDAGIAACDALGATGLHAEELQAPAVSGLPEDACLTAAIEFLPELHGPLNLVSVGARGYSVLTRDRTGRVQALGNDKCSSGTGETMVRIAGRFGVAIEEADALARRASDAIPITARCSVFAKSEMTHFGNQGRPADALFRGYFGSVARYVAALLARVRVDGPVYAVGGCARIGTLVDALSEALDTDVIVPESFLVLEAIGAALLAAEQCRHAAPRPLPADPNALLVHTPERFTVLQPASRWQGRVRRLAAPPVSPGAERAPCVLGLDLGSTGSKAALTSVETGELILDVYDRTQGNPVDAVQRLVRTVLTRTTPDVRAIALTGSGREAAATVIRAAFPEAADRIATLNEIVAHATAAIRCDDSAGESMSVVEIGGQDAKFIQIEGGRIVESDMNKACSAGTGSFLEEQAHFYGVDDIGEFTRMAMAATRPPDLGQMCTVFVADAAAEAHNEGFGVADLFAGFQYSVIHNYINRVMGQRTFGQRIFFQGKPASGVSLAWTLAAVTGREVVVPPNPGAMGAWGIGLSALDEFGAARLVAAPALDLARVLDAEVVGQSEFQCRDRQCATLCTIERTRVVVSGAEETVLSGGACPKYEVAGGVRVKPPKEAPVAFDERAALLAPYLAGRPGARTVGIPVAGATAGYVPWMVEFVATLGFGVGVLAPDARSLSRGEERCYSYDACAPVKVAHGVLDAGVERIFFPTVLATDSVVGGCGRTCAMEQAQPAMAGAALRARGSAIEVISPVLSFDTGPDSKAFAQQALEAARELLGAGPDRNRVAAACRVAAQAQRRYDEALLEIGRGTLDYGRAAGIPVIPVCGPLHVIHDPVVNAGIPRLLRENGVLALPMDCFPLPAGVHSVPRMPWSDMRAALRIALASRERGDCYPLLLSSFGCNPASFGEQLFTALLEGHPHTTLESDGHGGTAGYTTRVQAFLHTVRRHDGRPSSTAPSRLRMLEPLPNPPIARGDTRQFVMPSVGEPYSRVMAANFRAFGLDAITPGPSDAERLRAGRRDCSGKECIPYQLIWGAFRHHLDRRGDDRERVLVQVTGQGVCRNCMFSVKDQLSLERLGLGDLVTMRDIQPERSLSSSFLARTGISSTVSDILTQLAAYHRALERTPGEVDRLHAALCKDFVRLAERPAFDGMFAGFRDTRRYGRALGELVERASAAYAALAARAAEDRRLRTVLLAGDIAVKMDEFANDGIVRRLAERGLKVAIEPSQVLLEYASTEAPGEIARTGEGRARPLVAMALRRMRRKLYERVQRLHPWIPDGAVAPLLAESARVLGRHPRGEAPVTIGSVLHYWKAGLFDGAVLVSPWGCGPALVSESILRHQADIPMLFVYNDGSPVDERRLNAFAFRLRREPSRAAPYPAVSVRSEGPTSRAARDNGHPGSRASAGGVERT
ncbi:acyl-CoA dehydratase activase-related protein [Candidatus Binatia bacterium]|nr:acyl-CoA dehydratase activase-related protein [Candidatus Binatia bacterium]